MSNIEEKELFCPTCQKIGECLLAVAILNAINNRDKIDAVTNRIIMENIKLAKRRKCPHVSQLEMDNLE